MMTPDFPLNSFYAVVTIYSFTNLPRDEQATTLRRTSRWLKPGGWLLANSGAKENGGSAKSEWLGERVEGGCVFWGCGVQKGYVRYWKRRVLESRSKT